MQRSTDAQLLVRPWLLSVPSVPAFGLEKPKSVLSQRRGGDENNTSHSLLHKTLTLSPCDSLFRLTDRHTAQADVASEKSLTW